jgi:hypothetical protein
MVSRQMHPAPRSGEGGPRCAAAWWKGRGRAARLRAEKILCAERPLHHASHGPPPPLRGGGKEKRPRGAISARAMEGRRMVKMANGEFAPALFSIRYSLFAIRYSPLAISYSPLARSKKREAERRQTQSIHWPHLRMRRDPLATLLRMRGEGREGAARLSAFHRGSCLGEPTPPLSSGYALPGTRPWRALPAFSLSQSSDLLADRS